MSANNPYRVDLGHHIPKLMLLEIWPLNVFIGNRDDLTVFDVGGNIGMWCQAWMNTFSGQTKSYHVFEPLPGNIAKFRTRLADGMIPSDDVVQIHETCLGDVDGETNIWFNNPESAIASVLIQHIRVGQNVVHNDQSQTVPQAKLDTFCAERSITTIDLLKIDVEGYEWNVLMGAKDMIERGGIRSIYMEFGQHQQEVGQSFRQFWEFFKDNGLHVYRQAVGRNFFGMQQIHEYHQALEDFSSMWMLMASRHGHDKDLNRPMVIGQYRP